MKLVLLTHPAFMGSQSMPRFAGMLAEAYRARAHEVQICQPKAVIYRLFKGTKLAKWAGYVDQYLLFPLQVRWRLRNLPAETLFVFCDQALGPWVPRVAHRPHVIHVHDLLALRSALGDIPENPTGWSGRLYQRYIRRGFEQGRNFISISQKSREDLQRFSRVQARISEVVYNGLNFPFSPMPESLARQALEAAGHAVPQGGFLLHLGGGQWYKNLRGVLLLYRHYAASTAQPLSLWCISPPPSAANQAIIDSLPVGATVRFFKGVSPEVLQAAYSMARAFLFPSLAEGFGWPIIEAMACGCPVLTTDAAPMNEVGGDAAAYVRRLQTSESAEDWAGEAAVELAGMLGWTETERHSVVQAGIERAALFSADAAIEAYLEIYGRVVQAEARRTQAPNGNGS